MSLVNARRTASLVGPQGVAGSQGPTGAPGTPGTPGAVTITTANYTQPAVNSQVLVSVNSTAAFQTGNYVAQGANYYTVGVIYSATQMYLQLVSGATQGTLFSAPANIAIVGPAGATGPAGSTGATGPQGPAGTNGASGVIVPVFFAALSTTTPPVSGHGATFIDGYAAQGDGGGGYFYWNATSTATPDQGTIAQVTGVSTGRWIRNGNVFNVTNFGAVGNGLYTSASANTAAFNLAITAFEAANAASQASGLPGAYVLYAPAGTYCIIAPLTFTGVIGGIFRGDGEGATVIQAYSLGYNNTGVQGVLVRKNCQRMTIEDMSVQQGDYGTLIGGSGLAQGATTLTWGSGAPIPTSGQLPMRVTLAQSIGNGNTVAELISIVGVSGGVVTFATPTLYAYAANDWVLSGALAGVVDYTDHTAISTNNRCRRVTAGSTSQTQLGAGFATDCLGGGPTYLTAAVTGGAGATCTVYDASRIVAGGTVRFWNNIYTAGETKVVSSVNYLTNVVTMTTTIASSYAQYSLLVAGADANNDEHIYEQCTALNCMHTGWLVIGWNSDDLKMIMCADSGCYATVSARQGGNFTWLSGVVNSSGVDFEYGGPMTHECKVIGAVTEAGSKLLLAHSVDRAQSLAFKFTHYDKLGAPSGDMITVTSQLGTHISFTGCNLAQGASSGVTMSVTNVGGSGTVEFSGDCLTGISAYTLSAVTLKDYGTYWGSVSTDAGPTETLSGGSGVYARGALYGGAPPVDRDPIQALTLNTGTNVDITTYGSSVLVATGPTGVFSLDGFQNGALGQRLQVIMEVNEACTVKHHSSSETTTANQIATPTGADIVLAAPGSGGFTYAEFRYDGSKWRFLP